MTNQPVRRLPVHRLPVHRLPVRRMVALLGAAVLVVSLVVPSLAGAGPLPPLGQLLSPGSGIWRTPAEATAAQPEEIQAGVLDTTGTIGFEPDGATHITAGTDSDLFRLTGYVHARQRLFQMDLARRRGSGELSEILGAAALESDRFELDLGLRRAAERDWAALGADDPARVALTAYAEGVNTAIDAMVDDRRLPLYITMLGYAPRQWTPVDSLVIQHVMAQTLSFSDRALTFSYPAQTLPPETFQAWFPTVLANQQYPYDPGPYRSLPLEPLPVAADPAAASTPVLATVPQTPGTAVPSPTPGVRIDSLGPLQERLAGLPAGAVSRIGNSNGWVVAGSRTASGEPLLALDPHLQMTIPSPWYPLEGRSPGYHYSGITIPGVPVPVMGKTDHFAWGMTNSQHPATLYYLQTTDPSRPDQYLWNGAWREMATHQHRIAVRGQDPAEHTVRFTAQGPVVQQQGVTAAVWWAGVLPQNSVGDVLTMLRSTTFAEFRESLRGWVAPSMTFMFAGRNGEIGAVTPGVAPQVQGHDITLPLPGDGSADVRGTIPFDALPQAADPPGGYLVSANHREVTADYPYQFSTSYNFTDLGWRGQMINESLAAAGPQTFDSAAALQMDQHDVLAKGLVPPLLKALEGAQLSDKEREVVEMLRGWDFTMDHHARPGLWFKLFYNRLTYVTFGPWWKHHEVQDDPDASLTLAPDSGSYAAEVMRGTVLAWIQHDPENRFFTPPGGPQRDATDVLQEAFHQSIAAMISKYGDDVAAWEPGLHRGVLFASLFDVPDLDVGPYPFFASDRTINTGIGALVRDGDPVRGFASAGATWRLVVDWGTGQAGTVMPGGVSEDPRSPWYATGVEQWLDGGLLPLREGDAAEQVATIRWRFTP
ncbi:penicillin acylase family protein [Pseudonocardia sp. TRM90224]|uniref:penicillin acylase family protein n=1 Tax=Pseudonocardia sp. TRM90224 TaxID=2812678 RepID=UPI001E5CDA56|nr:penicillin acylase family protein [Pseudonocardia sp. TRM90224]